MCTASHQSHDGICTVEIASDEVTSIDIHGVSTPAKRTCSPSWIPVKHCRANSKSSHEKAVIIKFARTDNGVRGAATTQRSGATSERRPVSKYVSNCKENGIGEGNEIYGPNVGVSMSNT
jgi:hypothetical protein